MTEINTSLSENEVINEVRTMLGGLGPNHIPDGTIIQQKERFAVPDLEAKGAEGSDSDIETAVLAYTAELAFKSWLKKKRIVTDEVEASFDIEAYRKEVEEQAEDALRRVGIDHGVSDDTGVAFSDSTDGWL